MDTDHTTKKKETVKGSLLLLAYLLGLGLLVNLTASNPDLGQYLTSGLMAVGIIYVLIYLTRTWIDVERAGE